jgi:hypothetical protein
MIGWGGRTDSAKQELTPSNLAICAQRFVSWFVKVARLSSSTMAAQTSNCAGNRNIFDDGGTSMAEGIAKRIKRRLCFNKSFA